VYFGSVLCKVSTFPIPSLSKCTLITGEDARYSTYTHLEVDINRLQEIFLIDAQLKQLKIAQLHIKTLHHPDATMIPIGLSFLMQEIKNDGIKPASVCSNKLLQEFLDDTPF
jgi:predicted oxidoreductase